MSSIAKLSKKAYNREEFQNSFVFSIDIRRTHQKALRIGLPGNQTTFSRSLEYGKELQ
jgi:hypothetical protein